MTALIDHYKAVRARMGMAPAAPVVRIERQKPVVAFEPPTVLKPVRVPQDVLKRTRAAPPSPLITDVQKPLTKEERVPLCAIQFAVCDYYRMTHRDLVGFGRKDKFTMPRHLAMWMCVKVGQRSYAETARAFGNRDHTSVLYAVRRVNGLLSDWRDMEVAVAIAGIRAKLFEDQAVYWGA